MRENQKTAEEVAAAVGVHQTTISRLISSGDKKQRRRPSIELAEKIAVFTGGQVTANDFMDDDAPRSPAEQPSQKDEAA